MATSFKDLTIWQKGMELVDRVYDIIDLLPKDEKFGLIDQMRRAVISIPSNIAEGHKRGSDKDFKHFLTIANGSCAELETQILIAQRRGMISDANADYVLSLCNEEQKMLHAMILKM